MQTKQKVKFVNVAEESIAEHGVVSECVALSMAKRRSGGGKCRNRRRHFRHCRAFRRLTRKPVGTVCFGFYFGGKAECGIPKFEISKTMHFDAAGRQAVRNASVNFVFETLAELLRAD